MAGDELFKRYLEIGAAVLGMSRERAETIVADLVASGEVAKGQATKAADWLVERGRTGTEELAGLVRREIRQQITSLGLASKDDIARLEGQIQELRAATTVVAPAAAAAPPGRKAATAGKAAAGPKSAGITRKGTVRKRPGASGTAGSGASGTAKPGAAPPAGGADPTKV